MNQSPTTPTLYTQAGSNPSPNISIVIPTLNESHTIKEFIQWCHEGLKKANVTGQILIIDSSTDDTPNIALAAGAEVLRVQKKGLGRAYIDSIPFIRGEFVIMGDADLTYDFRELEPFIAAFKTGAQYVMGSRFKGSIEDGSMPALHRYFGTPLTTWILNTIYSSKFSDIHCGMRGITLDALKKINLTSQSWEYASEMVLKAARMKLTIQEVPVAFYKDREGRVSHHKRMGWLSPWIAGWINLKVMLIYAPDKLLFWPGAIIATAGIIVCSSLAHGSLTLAGITFNLYWMLLGITAATLGYSCMQIAAFASLSHRLNTKVTSFLTKVWTYNRGIIGAALLTISGISCLSPFALNYITNNFKLYTISNLALFGLLLVILGFQTFSATILLELIHRTNHEK